MKQQKKNKEKIKKAETKHSQTKKSEKKKDSAETKSVEKKTKLVKSKTKTKVSPVASIQKEKKEKKVRIKKEVVITKPTIKLQLKDGITPQEIAQNIQQPVSKVITEFMKLGMIVSATQKVTDKDAIILVCSELGYEIEFEETQQPSSFTETTSVSTTTIPTVEEVIHEKPITVEKKVVEKKLEEKIIPEGYVKKVPVVTIMGHVDHGKTTLLDTIRKSNIAAKEYGAITQHIGAYKVKTPHGDITFIDTPGHEAFSAIRARGAKVTDIVVIVVAGDEGVMPQTIESINHAKAASVPIIVAINKIDLPQCNVNKVKQQFSDLGFIPSDWGGQTEFVEISARNNINIDKLLDAILLQAELMELYVPINVPAEATVIETKVDKKRGYVATVIVSKGKLKIGDSFVCGNSYGKVRAMFDDKGEKLQELLPGEPAEILGFEFPTTAGDILKVVKDEKEAKKIFEEIQEREKIEAAKIRRHLSIQDIISGKSNVLSVVLKGDTQGSIEAIQKMLAPLIEEVKKNPDLPELKIIHSNVGEITESDVLLASASDAVIIGFNVRPNTQALKSAKQEGIEIRTYRLIYELFDDIKNILQRAEIKQKIEEFLGRARVKKVFNVPKIGKVAGCIVEEGKIVRNAMVRVLRDNVIISETKINSLKHFKEDVKEIQQGYECGIGLENFQDIKENDVIECFQIIEK
jgi:translation initiation factor IF-2